MTYRHRYVPGPADLARVEKEGQTWTLVLVKQLHHPPEKVWQALTDPGQLREYIAMGAAGWHICLDVLERALGYDPLGRIVGPEVMSFEGWQRLRADYARQFGMEA